MDIFGLKSKVPRGGKWSLIVLFGLSIGLTSCDSMQNLQGYVVDAETGKPVTGATYRQYNKKKELKDTVGPYGGYQPPKTDSLGWFQGYQIVNGFPGGPRMKIRIEKEGYQPVDIRWKPRANSRDTLKILLEKGIAK
ncbi:hypothetical protein IBL28_21560 [Sinomicrobium sp. FJxs]|uniref:Carboxypeptidase regulatory-like domain-containing protein n=2 Tax=Sinomicrobium weinanense TaxID=2842200 RepID=A0A926JVX8_9FLAO|nr:hypothetical protein [Sinomicrobium weinanense]